MKKLVLTTLAVSLVAASCNSKIMLAQEQFLQIKQFKISVQLADTPQERTKGLSGVPSISDSEGMLFLFSEPQSAGFWMKDMKFGIDIIWILDNKIVGITDNVKPQPGVADHNLPKYNPPVPVDKVLEVNSGWAFRKDVQMGDTITVVPK